MIEWAILLLSLLMALPCISGFTIAYDLESTGKAPMVSRVVQICIMRLNPNGEREVLLQTLVNPEVPIELEATEVHGITDEQVANAPTFAQIADQVATHFTEASVVVGYNTTKFDNVMLDEELRRVGYISPTVSSMPQLDVKRLLEHVVPRDLNAVSERYLDRSIEGAHDARVDVDATVDIMDELLRLGQMNNMSAIDIASTLSAGNVTGDGRLVWEEGRVMVSFGKHQGCPLYDVVRSDRGYFDWVLSRDLSDFGWITSELIRCIELAINTPNEDAFNHSISESYGAPPIPEHECLDNVEMSFEVYGDEYHVDAYEIAWCSVCEADLTETMQDLHDSWEPDEDDRYPID